MRKKKIERIEQTLWLNITHDKYYEGCIYLKYELKEKYPPIALYYPKGIVMATTFNGVQLVPEEIYDGSHIRLPYNFTRIGENELLIYFSKEVSKAFKRDLNEANSFIFSDRGMTEIAPCVYALCGNMESNLSIFLSKKWEFIASEPSARIDNKETQELANFSKMSKAFYEKLDQDSIVHMLEANSSHMGKLKDIFVAIGFISELTGDIVKLLGGSNTLQIGKSYLPMIEKVYVHACAYFEKIFGTPFPYKNLEILFTSSPTSSLCGKLVVLPKGSAKDPLELSAELIGVISKYWINCQTQKEMLIYLAITEEKFLRQHCYDAILNYAEALHAYNNGKLVFENKNSSMENFNLARRARLLAGEENYMKALNEFLKSSKNPTKPKKNVYQHLGSFTGMDMVHKIYSYSNASTGFCICTPLIEANEGKITKFVIRRDNAGVSKRSYRRASNFKQNIVVKLYYECNKYKVVESLIEGKSEIEIPEIVGEDLPKAIFINSGGYGTFQTRFDSASIKWFNENLNDLDDEFDKILIKKAIEEGRKGLKAREKRKRRKGK